MDAVNITDNQTAIVRMSSIGSGVLAMREGLEPVVQMTCRDRNRLAIQSDLLAAREDHLHALGRALAEESFSEMEKTAGALRGVLLQSGVESVADHAMRVQMAARRGDLKTAAAAIRNLQASVRDGLESNIPSDPCLSKKDI